MKSGNLAFNERTYDRLGELAYGGEAMTVNGTMNKLGMLLFLVVAAAGFVWMRHAEWSDPARALAAIQPYWMGGMLAGFVLALVIVFKPVWAPVLAPVYAVAEGLFVGGLSAVMEMRFPGVVLQGVAATLAVAAAMFVLYRTGVIRVTDTFRRAVVGATLGIALLYVVTFALRAFGVFEMPFVHEGGTWGIAFSLFVVGLAAFNLALDFDLIERGVEMRAPRFMEWYAAFGLLVTLVWLYVEILRLLGKTRR